MDPIPPCYRVRLTFSSPVASDGTIGVHDDKTWDGMTVHSLPEADRERTRLVRSPPFDARLVWSAVIVSFDGGRTWKVRK
jgi:hypothetical protein